MEYFEGTYCENSNDAQSEDIEATLYSMVHHSEEVYNPNVINLTESYVTQRSKANRWEALKSIEASVNPENHISHFEKTPYSEALDHIPIGDHNIPSTSTVEYDKQYNRRDHNLHYAWKYNRNKKPWSMKDRIQNDYQFNRNLVPVHVEKKQISPQNNVNPQILSKNSYLNSFKNSNNVHASTKFSREGGKPAKYDRGMTYSESFEKNQFNPPAFINRMKNGEVFQSANFSSHHVVDTNVNQNKIINSNTSECYTVEDSIGSPPENCKKQNTSSKAKGNANSSLSSENVSEEIVIVTDTDDNCSDHSIVEITVPPKPKPLVISLDSSDETESVNVSNIEPVLNVTFESSKPLDFTYENSNFKETSIKNVESVNESLLSMSEKSKRIKKKKKDKRVKSIECKTWTSGMVHFYNKSWGGETYDHVKLQREMTSNPINWKILDIDKYGPVRNYGPLARVRCINCHQLGHVAKQCPDPRKIKCCTMCGKQGHGENQCPDKMCLKCGRPAPFFKEGCPTCLKSEHPKNCTSCGAKDHFQWLCPEEWRKFHSTTSVKELQLGTRQESEFKSPEELVCCVCTERGHTASKCPFVLKRVPLPNEQPLNIFATLNILNKKRKKKWRSSFDQSYNQNEFNRKRRKTR